MTSVDGVDRFKGEGDVEMAVEKIQTCDGVDQTLKLAKKYSMEAEKCLEDFPLSDYRTALVNLTQLVLHRRK